VDNYDLGNVLLKENIIIITTTTIKLPHKLNNKGLSQTVYSRLEKGLSTSRKTKGRPLMYTTWFKV